MEADRVIVGVGYLITCCACIAAIALQHHRDQEYLRREWRKYGKGVNGNPLPKNELEQAAEPDRIPRDRT